MGGGIPGSKMAIVSGALKTEFLMYGLLIDRSRRLTTMYVEDEGYRRWYSLR